MLSRIAESLFWIGRYIERSDGTARILDVHLQLLLEDPWIDEDTACRGVISVMGSEPNDDVALGREDVLALLAVDPTQPASIAHSIASARENARRAREIVSTELWETLNQTNARMPRRIAPDKTHEFFRWVRDRAALAVGVVDSATSRDEAWHFLTLGRSIERADMTARLLATRALTEDSGPSWTTILRSCGGYEAYLRSYRGVPSTQSAAEFLLLDRLFPRSIIASVIRAEESLREIDPRAGRVGVTDQARRLLGQIRSELEYRPDRRDPRRSPEPDGARAGGHVGGERGDPPAVLPGERRARVDRRGVMSRIRIVHRTGFSYDEPATASYNEARMLPHSGGEQFVLQAGLDIRPGATQHSYLDYWGTRVSTFEVLTPHRELSVTATSLVEVRPAAAAPIRARLGRARRRVDLGGRPRRGVDAFAGDRTAAPR